jgi:hypothetical protein
MSDASGKKRKKKKGFLRRILRLLVFGGIIGYVVYAISERQRPGPSVPAGTPEERVLVKDRENLSGLGALFESLVMQMLEDPAKVEILNTMSLALSIEPREEPETAITITFSDGYVVIEPGVVPDPDVKITCELPDLMQMAQMGSGLDALRYMATPDGKEFAAKILSGALKLEGAALHPIGMMKFSRFMATA